MGLVSELGEWVLNAAAGALAELNKKVDRRLFIAVNISSRQFQGAQLVDAVDKALVRHRIDPDHFHLELTESAMMEHPEEARATIFELKELGVQLSVDDFGTGYSSLAYLKRFPFDSVKIDSSFVEDILTDSDDAAIAAAIIAMSHSLGLEVIAEGVETEEQLSLLARKGCNYFQGYLDSKPLTLVELIDALEDHSALMKRSVANG
jgi:EAL domain-containing protein (putative c-di-GMP-specific phosphodiesterase class I)